MLGREAKTRATPVSRTCVGELNGHPLLARFRSHREPGRVHRAALPLAGVQRDTEDREPGGPNRTAVPLPANELASQNREPGTSAETGCAEPQQQLHQDH